jgi:arylsulfatase A-like enzyme
MHGHDLSPLLRDPGRAWPHPVLLAATGHSFGSDTNAIPTDPEHILHGGVPWYVMLREKNWKYVRPLVEDLEELYDLERDPEELDNLAVKRPHQARLRRMRAAAVAELRKTGCGFVEAMPAVREAEGGD